MFYNQSYVVTSNEYFSILQQNTLAKEATKALRQQKRKKKKDKRAQRVVDSLIMTQRATQSLLDKQAKVMFNANWSTNAIKKAGDSFIKVLQLG